MNSKKFKSNVRETWRVILVSEADIFLSESLRILAERLSQSEIGLPLRHICYYSPPEEVGVFSTEIKAILFSFLNIFSKQNQKKEIYPRLDNISCDRFLFYFLYLVIITLYPSCRVW